MPSLRLQKILAQAGVASRRKAEELIAQGRVRVDGRVVTELGTKADDSAKVELDGKRLVRAPLCYGVLHKPRGMLTTLSDPEGRPTAADILRNLGLRVVPVGRLDFNTSGALLFTNDGDFAAGLSHAKNQVPKVYLAKVRGELDEAQLARWAERIEIDGRRTEAAHVKALRREGGHTWLEITLFEGRNRQVRRLGEHAGSMVVRLTRMSQAGITTEGLRPGEYRSLTLDELKGLKAAYGQPKRVRGAVLDFSELPGAEVRIREGSRTRRPAEGRRPERASSAQHPGSKVGRSGSYEERSSKVERSGPKAKRSGSFETVRTGPAERTKDRTEHRTERGPLGSRGRIGTNRSAERDAGVPPRSPHPTKGPTGARGRATNGSAGGRAFAGPARGPGSRAEAPKRSVRGSGSDRRPKRPR